MSGQIHSDVTLASTKWERLMNWDALGAIAEVVGAVSVLATLLYLAKQIKDNSKLLSATIQESTMQGYNNINQWAVGDPEIAALTFRWFVEDESEMTPLESFRLDMIIRIYCNHGLKLYHLFEQGVYPVNEWENSGREFKQVLLSTQAGRDFMRDNHGFDDLWASFDEFSEENISRFK
jgi:hypothetical protein